MSTLLDRALREIHATHVRSTEDGGTIDWNNMREVQDELTRWANSRFPTRTDHAALTKLVMEEVPEMLQHKKEHGTEEIGEELADAFILLMDLATLWEVDLPVAIHGKMVKNYQRLWKVDPGTGIAQHIDAQAPTKPPYYKPPCPECKSNEHVAELTALDKATIRSETGSDAEISDTHRCSKCKISFDDDIPF